MDRTHISERLTVSGQIGPDDLEALKASGVTTIINNRPDREERGQPLSTELESAARALGLVYYYLPVTPGAANTKDGARMVEIVANADGTVHAFCRTGNRSSKLFALGKD